MPQRGTGMPRPTVRTIVKIDGNVISQRDQRDCFDREAAAALAAEIPYPSVLVQGPGPLGSHFSAECRCLADTVGRQHKQNLLCARQKLAAFNNLFMEILLQYHGPAIAISATALFSDTARISFSGRRFIDKLMARGITPVIYSDLIFHGNGGLRVLTGDEIVSLLSPIYRPEYAIFATDVDGVYCSERSDEIYQHLSSQDLRTRLFISRSGNNISCGVHSKLEFACKAAGFSSNCIILNGLHPSRIRQCCEGAQDVRGTWVHAVETNAMELQLQRPWNATLLD